MILINKNTQVPELTYKGYDVQALDDNIKSLEHIREMLINFFGDRVFKCYECVQADKKLKHNNAGYIVKKYFSIKIFKQNSISLAGEIIVGEFHDSYLIQLIKVGSSSCKINGVARVEKLRNGDNFKQWFIDMKNRYDKHEIPNDINLLVFFGFCE